MSLVLAFLLITGGLLTAFLFPRDVQVDILDLNSTKHWVADKNASGVFDAILEVQVNPSRWQLLRLQGDPGTEGAGRSPG